jgi:hypothetical protein
MHALSRFVNVVAIRAGHLISSVGPTGKPGMLIHASMAVQTPGGNLLGGGPGKADYFFGIASLDMDRSWSVAGFATLLLPAFFGMGFQELVRVFLKFLIEIFMAGGAGL